MTKIKIAIQKSGRLSEKSIELLNECGINFSNSDRKLKAEAKNFPAEILFLRDDDIPQYVERGVADLGIIGENEVWEKDKNVNTIDALGFANCRLSLAIPKDENFDSIAYFQNKKIATSYPKILETYFKENKIKVEIEEIGGSVEIATSIGLADGIFDIVSTGSTLLTNGLKEVQVVKKCQAVLIANKFLNSEKTDLVNQLLFRFKTVRDGKDRKYILLNAPNTAISDIVKILPGMKSPTVLPLVETGWSSIHSVVKDNEFWDIVDQLKALGAEGILVTPIEKIVL